jgi:hypothetical protein
MRFKIGDYLRVKRNKVGLFSLKSAVEKIVLVVTNVDCTRYHIDCLVGDDYRLWPGHCQPAQVPDLEEFYESFDYMGTCDEEII